MGWIGDVIIVIVIGISVMLIKKLCYTLNYSPWVAKTAIIFLGFLAAYYLRVLEMPYYSTMSYWDWLIIALLGGIFSTIGIAIFNSEEGTKKKEQVESIGPTIPSVFDHDKMFPANPLVGFPHMYAGGKFYCKYEGDIYRIAGYKEKGFSNPKQILLKKINSLIDLEVEPKYCHLIAKSLNDFSDYEKKEMYIDGPDDIFSLLLHGIYPFHYQDFKKGIVLNIKAFEKKIATSNQA